MIRSALLALIVLFATGCGESPKTIAGFVTDVRSTSLTQIDQFTLRMPDGREIVFTVGPLELDGGAFPGGHLREHMALAQPVAVAYREEGTQLVAYRLADAPWLRR